MANLLTIDALDPTAKIPEYKYCAVRLAPADGVPPAAPEKPGRDAERAAATPEQSGA